MEVRMGSKGTGVRRASSDARRAHVHPHVKLKECVETFLDIEQRVLSTLIAKMRPKVAESV